MAITTVCYQQCRYLLGAVGASLVITVDFDARNCYVDWSLYLFVIGWAAATTVDDSMYLASMVEPIAITIYAS